MSPQVKQNVEGGFEANSPFKRERDARVQAEEGWLVVKRAGESPSIT